MDSTFPDNCRCGSQLIETEYQNTNGIACPYCCTAIDTTEHEEIIPEKYREKVTAILSYFGENFNYGWNEIEDKMKDWYEDYRTCLNLVKTADKETEGNFLKTSQVEYLEDRLDTEELSHARDQRNPFCYALQLILAWMEEDWVIEKLNNEGFTVEPNGKDSDREFLDKPDGEPHLKLKESGQKVEILHGFTGTWKSGKVDLRDNKFEKLGEDDFLLGIEYSCDYLFIVRKNEISDIEQIDSHPPYGGKPATKVGIPDKAFNRGKKVLGSKKKKKQVA